MTVSIFIGIIFLFSGIFFLSSNLVSKGLRMRTQAGQSTLTKVLASLFCLVCLVSATLQEYWYEELWRLVIFIVFSFALFQLGSTVFTMKIWNGITEFVRKGNLILSICFFALGLFLIARSYIGPVISTEGCKSDQEIQVICLVKNPEDLAVTPDYNFLIVSEFGGIEPLEEMIPGKLSLLNLKTEEVEPLNISHTINTWGDGLCSRKNNDLLGPHGIDLITRKDGLYQLAVVNHIEYESIEMYELIKSETSWELIWRGCVRAPVENYLNDVSLKSDGSLFVSHMYDRDSSVSSFLSAALFKKKTGYVLQWNNKQGFSKVVESEGSMPNGIAYSENNNLLYINNNLGDKVRVLDLNSKTSVAETYLNAPDNLILTEESLWVTTLDHEILDILKCTESITCTLPFSVYELDPLTLEEKQRFSFRKTVFGLPTVALPVKDKIWIGSFRSDRIAYLNLDQN